MRRATKLDVMQTEKALEGLYNTMRRLIQSPRPNLEGMSNRIGLSTIKLIDSLDTMGLDCMCRTTGAGRAMKYVCSCRKAKGAGLSGINLTARQMMATLGKSGYKCRDEDGDFVPVPQCTRKLPADITIKTPPLPKRKRKSTKKRKKRS